MHDEPAEHEVVQRCVDPLHVEFTGQSKLVAHPHAPPFAVAVHTCPTLATAQLTQAVPTSPHAPAIVPALHVPVVPPPGMLQQPPLHCVFLSHAAVHEFVNVLHARPSGQSEDSRHPHFSVLLEGTHALPFALPAHVAHTPGPVPQRAFASPALQMPLAAAEQQPVLHACVASH